MIGYLDTSALVPLLVAEPISPACRRLWDDADAVVSCRLMYVEVAAALAQAQRMDRLSARAHSGSLGRLGSTDRPPPPPPVGAGDISDG
ncbi:MAG TPA: type II toxin-antitoxin system VapC family toxin [Aldersonia sp.]